MLNKRQASHHNSSNAEDEKEVQLRNKIKKIISSDKKKSSDKPTKIHKDKLAKCYSSFKQVLQESHVEHYFSLGNNPPKESLTKFYMTELEYIEHLHIYDFDGTLFETLLPEDGIPLYESITRKSWPHGPSWWSRNESISTFTFEKDENDEHLVKEGEAYAHFLQAKKSQKRSDLIVMMTGRKNSLKRDVIEFLKHRLTDKLMPEVLCFKPDKYGGSNTLGYKVQQIYSFCNSLPNLKRITMWEDRREHATRFMKMEIKNFTLNSPVSITVQLVGKEKDGME